MNIIKKFEKIFSRYKIRTKMMLIYLAVIFPVFIGSIYLLSTIRTNVTENETKKAMETADSIKIRLTDMAFIFENIIDVICREGEIADFVSADYEKKSEIYNYYVENNVISNYVSILPQLEAVRIYIPRDDFAYNSTFRYADENITSQSWFKSIQNSNSPSWRLLKDPISGKHNLSCVRRINDRYGNFCAAAVFEVASEWLEEYVCGSNYNVILSLNNGIVYYSSLYGIKTGSVISDASSDISTAGVSNILDMKFNGVIIPTALKTFYPSIKSESVFQIFVINEDNNLKNETTQLTSIYVYYILFLFTLSLLIIVFFVISFTQNINLLSNKMHSVALGNFSVERELMGEDEICLLEEDLCVMVDSMQLMMNDVYNAKLESERLKLNQRDAEFKALASQINPHFLYNTLETIRMKAYCNNDKETADLIKKLGKFMRRCLEVKNDNVTLKSEIEFTNSYLELQSARFGDKVAYEIRSSVDGTYPILPLIIQPIVENAFVHGIESSKTNGKIDVHIYYCGDYVYIDVSDNGQGITPEKMRQIDKKLSDSSASDGKSIGLTNVNKRIKMSFGDIYGISVKSNEGKGTSVRIMLPRHPRSNHRKDGA